MSAFQRVRSTLALDVEASLQRLGVNLKQRGGEWLSVQCPLCTDKSGSCSIARDSLHLKCHQCQESLELFKWVMRYQNLPSVWEACKHLAGLWNLKLIEGRRAMRPRCMSDKLLAQTTHDLWDEDEAEGLRKFLVDRGLGDPLALEPFQIGYLNGKLTFPQRSEHGELLERYRLYSPGRWAWSRGKGISRALWPTWLPPEEGEDIWLLEGEWDVLVARIHLGLFAYCWTSPMAPLTPGMMPGWLKQRRVRICYDNDTFQPLGEDVYAPNSERRREFDKRRNNLLHGIGETLAAFGNEVYLHAVPISPVDNWGADFRDWYQGGGRNPDTIPGWLLEEVLRARPKAKEMTFDEAFAQPSQIRAQFQAQFEAMEVEGLVIPKFTEINCPIGEFSYCDNCGVTEHFPGQVIDWAQRHEDLASVLTARDPEREIMQRVLQKPRACHRCSIRHTERKSGYRWSANREQIAYSSVASLRTANSLTKTLTVISEDVPSCSSATKIRGTIHPVKQRSVVMADQIRSVDDASQVNLKDYVYRLHELCPWGATKPEQLEEYFQRRADDLAANVTSINDRRDIHYAIDLAYHSALQIPHRNRTHRGFLDICILGGTRTGKSEVARWLKEHYSAGQFLVGGENVSRVGLTAGVDKEGHIRPGLFPRNHGKLLVFDECHLKGRDGNIIGALQGPRDTGILDVAKIGSGTYPAAVRFILIGNTILPVTDHSHACEHFLDIYGTPECLSRMDFGVFVSDEVGILPPSRPHEWEADLAHALIMRAWRMEARDIRILPETAKLIHAYTTDWKDQYAEELPLYTSGEKDCSLRRIAAAASNWSFGHPDAELGVCEVRPCHAEWAANWLVHLWEDSGYKDYSYDTKIRFETVANAHVVEMLLTVNLGLGDHYHVINIIHQFLGEFSKSEVQSLVTTGDFRDAERWIGRMVRMGAVTAEGPKLRFTSGALKLLHRLLWIASEHPEEYVCRFQRLKEWQFGGEQGDSKLLSLEDHVLKLREGDRVYGSSETNIIPISPGP